MPAVTLITERFLTLADTTRKGRGLPEMPLVVLPSDIEYISDAELRRMADKALAEVLDIVMAKDGDGASAKG